MRRGRALRQKVNSSFGSLYAEVEFDDALDITRVSISHPSKHSDTAVGKALEALAAAFNGLLAEIRFSSRPSRRGPSPSAAAAPPAPPASAPGASFLLPQGEPDFEGGGT